MRALLGAALVLPLLLACRATTAATSTTATPVAMPEPVVIADRPVPPSSARDRLRMLADSARTAPMWRNARWGMLVVDAVSGDTLYSHDADRLFMPASNQKLLTGAIALRVLGADYRWRTPVLLRGRQRADRFEGDLLLVGSGDPSFSDSLRGGDPFAAFAPIVGALQTRGIRRITGHVRAAGDRFPGITTGFGWEIDDLDGPYGAPTDELLFSEGELTVRVRAGARGGDIPTVVTYPTRAYPAVVIEARTRDGVTGEPLRITYDSTGSRLHVTGTIAVGDSARFFTGYRHPADATVAAVTQALGAAGIMVDARARSLPPGVDSTASDTLTVLESASFADIMRRMQKPSQNQIAEMLFRTSGLHLTGVGTADSARAAAARVLAELGVGPEDAAYRDGSGMSRHDYVTPRALVRVLDAMRRSPGFELYRSALPAAGVDGTLRNRMRGTPAAGNAHAKTGTLDKARSLSGYVTSADGRLLMFSLLSNNFTVPTREVERVQDLIVVLLASERFAPR